MLGKWWHKPANYLCAWNGCPLVSLDVRVIYYGVMVIDFLNLFSLIHSYLYNYRYSQAQSSRYLFRPSNEARLYRSTTVRYYIRFYECLSLSLSIHPHNSGNMLPPSEEKHCRTSGFSTIKIHFPTWTINTFNIHVRHVICLSSLRSTNTPILHTPK